MKSFKLIFISLILIVSCFSFIACSSNEAKNYSFSLINNDMEYEIYQNYGMFSKTEGTVVIPNIYKNLPVTVVGSFGCCHGLTSVSGGKNIKTIAADAFGCRCWSSNKNVYMHLSEVVFDKDSALESIDSQAFFKCVALEKVVLPKSFKTFGEGVFFGCDKLTELYIYNPIPPTIETGLSSYHLPNGQETYTNFSSDFIVYVPNEAVETYKNSSWSIYNIQAID
jgi:hypothetical protein